MKMLFLFGFAIAAIAQETQLIGAKPATTYSYLPPSRACILSDEALEQSQVYLGLDFLYLQGGEEGLEFGFKNTGTQLQQEGTMHRSHFGWHPGVRALIGTHLPYDSWWDLDLSMTYYKSKTTDNIKDFFDRSNTTPGPGIISTWTAPFAFSGSMVGARWTSAYARWNFQTYIFDLMLRHNVCIGSSLSIEPAFGLKLGLLKQYYKVEYENGNTITDPRNVGVFQQLISSEIGMNSRSFNLGPEAALLSRWTLGSQWSLFGGISGALLGSRFSIKHSEFDYAQGGLLTLSDNVRLSDCFWTIRPETQLQLGLTWGGCVCRPDSVISYAVSVSYEAQYWWKQNMFLRYVSGDSTSFAGATPTQGDLFLHGLNIDARLDF